MCLLSIRSDMYFCDFIILHKDLRHQFVVENKIITIRHVVDAP